MSKSHSTNKRSRSYGFFAMAVAIYVSGVIAFSSWSYFQQRRNLLNQVDQSLINAAYATEQVLGHIFIECIVKTETIHDSGFAANQAKLSHLTKQFHFDALAVVVRKGTETWLLASGAGGNGTLLPNNLSFHSEIPPELTVALQELALSENENICVQNLHHNEIGPLRAAVLYQALSSDTGYALVAIRNIKDVSKSMQGLATRALGSGIFLLVMAFPLIALYSRDQKKATRKMAELNVRLQQDVTKQKEREAELEDAIRDLERFNAMTVGRESRIIELKAEVNTLLDQMKRQKRYNIDRVE